MHCRLFWRLSVKDTRELSVCLSIYLINMWFRIIWLNASFAAKAFYMLFETIEIEPCAFFPHWHTVSLITCIGKCCVIMIYRYDVSLLR